MKTLHDNEFLIDESLVKRLVVAQYPQWTGLDLNRLNASGSSNVLFQLGDELLVRLPRQPAGGKTILKECEWLPRLKRHLSITIPEIVVLGEPSEIFPEHWSVQKWVPGNRVSAGSHLMGPSLASGLANAITELRSMPLPDAMSEAPGDALRPYRGQSLQNHDRAFRRNLEACRNMEGLEALELDLDAVINHWEQALAQPEAPVDSWFHSDLVAENLLVDDEGNLVGILDFGGLGIGDPAIDLHGAWEIFDEEDRSRFRGQLDVDDAEWSRGRAWALAVPLMTFSYYWQTMPERIQDRLLMIRAALAESTE